MTLLLGQPIPDFSTQATGGQTVSPAGLAGRQLVLYFYPKDNTPGCTQEGLDFRDQHPAFLAANTWVYGVSRDSLRTHENFKAKQGFPFELISDPNGTLCQLFEVIKPKKLYGREYIGIERSTFLIDRAGVLRQQWRGVKVPSHVDQVLAAAVALQQGD